MMHSETIDRLTVKPVRSHTDQRGYILGVVLIFFLVFTLLGLAFIRMADLEGISALKHAHKSRAYYYAAAGIHKGLWRLNSIGKAAASFSDSMATVVFDSTSNTLTATSSVGAVSQAIRATLVKQSVWKVQKWQDW